MSALAANVTDVCRIVVVYEDRAAHDGALELAGRLSDRLGTELTLVFDSWNFKDLADPRSAHAAAEAAIQADVIVLSAHGNDLPSAVSHWLELCAARRVSSDGALALFLAEPFMLSPSSERVISRLQHAAGLLGMDFLPLIPESAEQIIQSFKERAGRPSTTHRNLPDPSAGNHWGLNE